MRIFTANNRTRTGGGPGRAQRTRLGPRSGSVLAGQVHPKPGFCRSANGESKTLQQRQPPPLAPRQVPGNAPRVPGKDRTRPTPPPTKDPDRAHPRKHPSSSVRSRRPPEAPLTLTFTTPKPRTEPTRRQTRHHPRVEDDEGGRQTTEERTRNPYDPQGCEAQRAPQGTGRPKTNREPESNPVRYPYNWV